MKVLVTGGGGFLGQAICAQLLARGHSVRTFNRSTNEFLTKLGVDQRRGNIQDMDAVANASDGVDAIIHTAGKVGVWGSLEDFYDVNVVGTDHVIAACELHGIRKLVFTSSPSVIQDGTDKEGVDETTPYSLHFSSPYGQTKALAEQHVLQANGSELATVALRPHFIWGPGDPNLLPRVLALARAGRLRMIGEGGKRVDTIFVDNAAYAHLLALEKLDIGSPIAGSVYFLSQGEPVTHEHLINAWLLAAGLPAESRRMPLWLARSLANALETVYRLAGIRHEPPLTRYVVEELSTSHWFNIDAARADLGYAPKINITEGMRRLTHHFATKRGQNAAR